MSDKEKFCKEVTIICDTREQEIKACSFQYIRGRVHPKETTQHFSRSLLKFLAETSDERLIVAISGIKSKKIQVLYRKMCENVG